MIFKFQNHVSITEKSKTLMLKINHWRHGLNLAMPHSRGVLMSALYGSCFSRTSQNFKYSNLLLGNICPGNMAMASHTHTHKY